MKEEKHTNQNFKYMMNKYLECHSKTVFIEEYIQKGCKYLYIPVAIITWWIIEGINLLMFGKFLSLNDSNDFFKFLCGLAITNYLFEIGFAKYKIHVFAKKSGVRKPTQNSKNIFLRDFCICNQYENRIMKAKNREFEQSLDYEIYNNLDSLKELMSDVRFIIDDMESKKINLSLYFASVVIPILVLYVNPVVDQIAKHNSSQYSDQAGILLLTLLFLFFVMFWLIRTMYYLMYDTVFQSLSRKDLNMYYDFLTKRYLLLSLNQKKKKTKK